MKLIGQTFETPISETFTWSTNIIVSDNGTEQRISLLDPPIRTLSPTYNFTSESDARSLVRAMFVGQGGFLIPAWHLATKVAPAAAGAASIAFDPLKTEVRDGCAAVLFDRVSGALATIALAAVLPGGAGLAAPLAAPIGRRTMIAPLWAMIGSDNATLSRGNVNATATATMSLRSLDFVDPFLDPRNTSELEMFNGLPVLPNKATGTSFDMAFNTGATLIDYGAAVTIRSRWKHTQEQFTRDYLCQRVHNPADWQLWQAFADYCKGSCNPFYVPTFRPDFGIVGTAAGNTVTLKGLDYAQDFFPFEAFKQFAFFTGAGRHNASVTACVANGGNSLCTIDPPLPDGAGYAIDQVASLLLRSRIADDKVSFNHEPLHTTVTLAMRTTDE